MDEKIVVAFATDRKYRYYTGVTLYSLIQHASSDTEYEIILLCENLTEEDQEIFTRLISGKEKFSLHFIDMHSKIREIGADKFYTTGHYAISVYYRLFLPEILPQYDKVLYLDSDLIVQTDIKKLYSIDIGDFALAAVTDRGSSSIPLNVRTMDFYCYCRRVLGLRKPKQYFNSGVLIINLQKLRNSDYPQRIRTEISSGIHFVYPDQDILNRIFDGKTFYLNKSWNYMTIQKGTCLEKKSILHFAGVLHPWISTHLPNCEIWWEVAEKSLLAEKIRKVNYCSPEQMKYYENIDFSYNNVIKSSCWRYTAFYRYLRNFPSHIRRYISIYRNAYNELCEMRDKND